MKQRGLRSFPVGGLIHYWFRNTTTLPRSKTRLNDPSILARKYMRTLHDVEESALPHQPVKIADHIASEFLVVKIPPEPKHRTAVVDVAGARLGALGNDKEREQGLRERDPSFDLGELSHIQQSLHRSIRASTNLD